MILVESINMKNDVSRMSTFGSRVSYQAMADPMMSLVLNINGEDARRVAEAINSDGTIYPDKIIDALGSRKREISNEPIKLTRGIDL